MNIRAYNSLTVNAPYSYTSLPVNSGVASIPIKNPNGYTASHAIQIGQTNEETSEIKMLGISTPTGTALSITGTVSFDHPTDTPVYDIKYDQLVFARATAGTTGAATVIANGTVSITPDDNYTTFDDPTGALTYAYKAAYRNSITGVMSAYGDWLTSSGYTFYSKIELRNRLKNKLFNSGFIKSDDVIDEWMNEWLEQMNNAAIKVNEEYSLNTTDVAFGTNGYGTVTAQDFKRPIRVWVSYDNGVTWNKSTKIPLRDIVPNDVYSTVDVHHAYKGDSVIQILPSNTAGTARIDYATLISPLVEDTDELPVVMRGYSKSFIDYALAQAYYMDGKDSLGQLKENAAMAGKQDFVSEITPRDDTGPQYITFDAPLTGDESSDW